MRRVVGVVHLCLLMFPAGCRNKDVVIVGSKNFTESILLGEIVAQQLEHSGIPVERRLNLGGTFICQNAQISGQLDVYVEYTGTAYTAILELSGERNAERNRVVVDSVYAARWNLLWLEPLGFNNTFAMLIRGEDAWRL